jgi:uncharacterized protein (TIGR02246 family)
MRAATPEQLIELMDAAYQAKDAEAVAALYEDDAIFANPPGGWTAVGRAEILDKVREMFAMTSAIDVIYDPPAKSVVGDDYAFFHFTTSNCVSFGDGAQHESQSRTTTIAHRGTDGSWRYVLDHNSTL